MHPDRSSSSEDRAELTADASTVRALEQTRERCWRISHQMHALQDTIVVLRAGANSLAIDNAILRIENERLRASAHAVRAENM